ncbi:class E sortase [soil metagenome]
MKARGELARTAARGFGQTMITVGLVLILFVVYEVWITTEVTQGRQSELTQDLRQSWETGDDPLVGTDPSEPGIAGLPLGEGFAFIRIPRFGPDFVRMILEGTDEQKLSEGPGHYPGSALPGEVGNFALAGHRVGRGAPFGDLDQLQQGDAIVIETSDSWFVYRTLDDAAADIPGRRIVDPGAVEVVEPVPGQPGVAPTRSLLTLTTCHPRFSNAQRLIVHAELAEPPWSKRGHPDGPPALAAG